MLSAKIGYNTPRVHKTDILLTSKFSTSNTAGSWSISGTVRSTTGYFKVEWGDSISTNYGSGNKNSTYSFSKTYSSTSSSRVATLYSTNSVGDKVGAITYLTFSGPSFRSVDISNQTSLTYVVSTSSSLTSFTAENCMALETLSLTNGGTVISSFSLNGISSSLTSLTLSNCGLTSVNLNNFSRLSFLNIGFNPLGTLDVSALRNLQTLYCWSCSLTSLTVPPSLTTLYCTSNSSLGTLDLSNKSLLSYLDCTGCSLTSLNVTGTALTNLYAQTNNLTSIIGLPTTIAYLNIGTNLFTSLSFDSSYTSLGTVSTYGTPSLTSISISSGVPIYDLSIGNCAITSLNMDNIINTLSYLDAGYNSLTSVSASGYSGENGKAVLYLYSNSLSTSTLDSFFTNLSTASGFNNYIDVSDNPGSCTADATIATNKDWTVFTGC